MKKRITFVIFTAVVTLILAVVVVDATSSTTADVSWWWGDPAGSSTIVRTETGIKGSVKTALSNEVASAEGLAVTLWLVVFNNPESCTDGCGLDDLGNPAVKPDILYAAGRVADSSEEVTLGYRRNVGDNSGSIADLMGLPTNNGEPWGLIDANKAEVHYVLRSHGPENPAEIPDQIQTYAGGCVLNAPFGHDFPASPADLYLNAGDCQDIQFAVHLAE